jgi:hypothetical protein
MYICPHCGDLTDDETRPCPTCNRSPKQQDGCRRAPLDWAITITFGQSPSKYYDEALDLARRANWYKQEGAGEEVIHTVRFGPGEIEEARELWDIIHRWVSSSMAIEGEEISKKDLTYGGLGCYQNYREFGGGREFCFGSKKLKDYGSRWYDLNFLGCKSLGMSAFDRCDQSDQHSGPSWNGLGHFDEDDVWHFDKEQIRDRLEKRIHRYRFCPLLQPGKAYSAVERLTDTVDPDNHPDWFLNGGIPNIPDHAYESDGIWNAVVLRPSGFSRLNPFDLSPEIPYESHAEYYIEKNLSVGIKDGEVVKDRGFADILLTPPGEAGEHENPETQIRSRRWMLGVFVVLVMLAGFLLAALL